MLPHFIFLGYFQYLSFLPKYPNKESKTGNIQQFLQQKFSQKRLFLVFRIVSIIYQVHSLHSPVRNVFFCTYLFQNSLPNNSEFIMLVLSFVWQFRHKYGHSNGHNNEFIRLVLHMFWQFRHNYVQSKVGKSMFHFIHQISYVSTIDFLFNQ